MAIIRLARQQDVAGALAISNAEAARGAVNLAIEPEALADWHAAFEATQEMHPWFVALDDGRVVGFAKASPWNGRCAYAFTAEATIYIEPAHQGAGLGRALYGRLFPLLRAQGYRTLIAGITQPNDASVRLHEVLGMRRVALFEKVGWKRERWWDVGYWQLEFRGEPGEILSVREALQSGDTGRENAG